jgi:hypothetical protein
LCNLINYALAFLCTITQKEIYLPFLTTISLWIARFTSIIHEVQIWSIKFKKGNRTNYGKFSIKYTGTEIWNGIPKKIKDSWIMYKKEIQNGNENIFVVSRQTISL